LFEENEILIVAGPEDGLALKLHSLLETKGRRAQVLDGMSAARLFTIRVREGTTTVTPALPMFLRASAWWTANIEDLSSDERFLRMEAYNTLWAAACLSSAPVINRPSPDASAPRLTWGSLCSLAPAETWGDEPEIYASGPELIEDSEDAVWGEDSEFAVAQISQLPRGAPLRARRVDARALYEIITVVGDRAFPATADPRTTELQLPAQSLQIAQRVGVQFATITWSVSGDRAAPVRLNTAPELNEIRYSWNEVSEALYADLVTCSGAET
jgi:hypothetical protein